MRSGHADNDAMGHEQPQPTFFGFPEGSGRAPARQPNLIEQKNSATSARYEETPVGSLPIGFRWPA
jgi:hypothetical protein